MYFAQGGKDVQEQMRAGDQEAEAMNVARERQDSSYDPNEPREEQMEREFRGE